MTLPAQLHSTPVLRHLRQRHLLADYLLAGGLEPEAFLAQLRKLSASPEGLPSSAFPLAVSRCLEELHLLTLQPPSALSLPLPFGFVQAVNIELTYSCNLACSHCLQDGLRPVGQHGWLPTEPIVRLMREARLLGLTRTGVNITGGEIFAAGSPVLELLAAAAEQAIPSRANTNAWWGSREGITIGDHHFTDDAAVVSALRQRNLGRLALSLDHRYEQYPALLDRVIRVAVLCEQAEQPYEVIATEPGRSLSQLASSKLFAALGRKPRHLHLTLMETVDIGAAAHSNRDTLDPGRVASLVHLAPCATAGFHRPYYLHVGPDGGLRSCLYAPGAGWLGNVLKQPLAALLNAAATNPIALLFASGGFDGFMERAVTPWRHHYADPHHGCAASALLARIAELVHQLESSAGRPATAAELENLHRRVAGEYRLTPASPAAPVRS